MFVADQTAVRAMGGKTNGNPDLFAAGANWLNNNGWLTGENRSTHSPPMSQVLHSSVRT